MIEEDIDGDQWRYSASRKRMEVACLDEDAEGGRDEWGPNFWGPMGTTVSDEEWLAIMKKRRSGIDWEGIFRRCKENPEP